MDRIAFRTYAAAAMAGGADPATASLFAEEMCTAEDAMFSEGEAANAARPIDRVTRAELIVAARNSPTAQKAAAQLGLTTSTFTRYCRKWKIKTPAERRKSNQR